MLPIRSIIKSFSFPNHDLNNYKYIIVLLYFTPVHSYQWCNESVHSKTSLIVIICRYVLSYFIYVFIYLFIFLLNPMHNWNRDNSTVLIINGTTKKLQHFFNSYFFPVNLVLNTKTLQLQILIKNYSNALFLSERFFNGWDAKS